MYTTRLTFPITPIRTQSRSLITVRPPHYFTTVCDFYRDLSIDGPTEEELKEIYGEMPRFDDFLAPRRGGTGKVHTTRGSAGWTRPSIAGLRVWKADSATDATSRTSDGALSASKDRTSFERTTHRWEKPVSPVTLHNIRSRARLFSKLDLILSVNDGRAEPDLVWQAFKSMLDWRPIFDTANETGAPPSSENHSSGAFTDSPFASRCLHQIFYVLSKPRPVNQAGLSRLVLLSQVMKDVGVRMKTAEYNAFMLWFARCFRNVRKGEELERSLEVFKAMEEEWIRSPEVEEGGAAETSTNQSGPHSVAPNLMTYNILLDLAVRTSSWGLFDGILERIHHLPSTSTFSHSVERPYRRIGRNQVRGGDRITWSLRLERAGRLASDSFRNFTSGSMMEDGRRRDWANLGGGYYRGSRRNLIKELDGVKTIFRQAADAGALDLDLGETSDGRVLKEVTGIWNVLIWTHSVRGLIDQALAIYRIMVRGVESQVDDVLGASNRSGPSGSVNGTLRLNPPPPDFVTFSMMIQSLCYRGYLHEAHEVLRNMTSPSISDPTDDRIPTVRGRTYSPTIQTFTSFFMGFARHGSPRSGPDGVETLDLLEHPFVTRSAEAARNTVGGHSRRWELPPSSDLMNMDDEPGWLKNIGRNHHSARIGRTPPPSSLIRTSSGDETVNSRREADFFMPLRQLDDVADVYGNLSTDRGASKTGRSTLESPWNVETLRILLDAFLGLEPPKSSSYTGLDSTSQPRSSNDDDDPEDPEDLFRHMNTSFDNSDETFELGQLTQTGPSTAPSPRTIFWLLTAFRRTTGDEYTECLDVWCRVRDKFTNSDADNRRRLGERKRREGEGWTGWKMDNRVSRLVREMARRNVEMDDKLESVSLDSRQGPDSIESWHDKTL